MDERLRFVARLLDGEKMAVVCEEFVASPTGNSPAVSEVQSVASPTGAHRLYRVISGPCAPYVVAVGRHDSTSSSRASPHGRRSCRRPTTGTDHIGPVDTLDKIMAGSWRALTERGGVPNGLCSLYREPVLAGGSRRAGGAFL
jgi:hypothetical protein